MCAPSVVGRLTQNFAQKGCEFQIELLNMAVHLKIILPLWKLVVNLPQNSSQTQCYQTRDLGARLGYF